MEVESKSILEMSAGAIMERVNYEMAKVLENIMDVNTRADAKRKLTLTLEMLPSADRSQIAVKTVCKCTLVPTEPVMTSLFVTSSPVTGEMVIAEAVPQIPGQADVYGGVQGEPKLLRFAGQA